VCVSVRVRKREREIKEREIEREREKERGRSKKGEDVRAMISKCDPNFFVLFLPKVFESTLLYTGQQMSQYKQTKH
jgi:hypothetical protein